MRETRGYGQFCPIAIAAEVLAERWTPLVIRELLCGSVRFNDLQRGVPRMSSALLARRLRELQHAGIIERRSGASGSAEYHLTPAGKELFPVIEGMGLWAQRWLRHDHLDPGNLDPPPVLRSRQIPAPSHLHRVELRTQEVERVCSKRKAKRAVILENFAAAAHAF